MMIWRCDHFNGSRSSRRQVKYSILHKRPAIVHSNFYRFAIAWVADDKAGAQWESSVSSGKSVRIELFSRGCPVCRSSSPYHEAYTRSSPFALVAKAMKTKKTEMREFTEMLYWLSEGNAGSGILFIVSTRAGGFLPRED